MNETITLQVTRYRPDKTTQPVPVDYQVVPGMVHGFLTMGGKVDAANRSIEIIASALKRI